MKRLYLFLLALLLVTVWAFAAFAADEIPEVRADAPIKRADIVRLYMESAIPSSKLDLRAVDMAIEWKQ